MVLKIEITFSVSEELTQPVFTCHYLASPVTTGLRLLCPLLGWSCIDYG